MSHRDRHALFIKSVSEGVERSEPCHEQSIPKALHEPE